MNPRLPYDALKHLLLLALQSIDALLSRWRKPPRILWQLPGTDTRNSANLCVFAHYDRHGRVAPYVVEYLHALQQADCHIVFVSTAPDLTSEAVAPILPLCRTVICRENLGYDFGSFKTGLATVPEPASYQRVILANDSVYGPLQDLGEIFPRMQQTGADFWGITDSWRYTRHLHSYFIAFERRAVQHPVFQQFWQQLPWYSRKHAVIMGCEVKLSRQLQQAGLTMQALCDYQSLRNSHPLQVAAAEAANWPGTWVNSSLWLWDLLLEQGCPFIKAQLLQHNPKGLRGLENWRSAIEQYSDYDTRLIAEDLATRQAGTMSSPE